MHKKAKIGIFDSGSGGLSVVAAIHKALPDYETIFKDDVEHVPYGNLEAKVIYSYCKPILEDMLSEGCDVIVVACNTVTTNLIERLRGDIEIPLIGMEPMVKPAAENSKSKVIAVCATPRTLSSARYQWLKKEYAKGVKVLEPDCSDWSYLIETNNLDREKIADTIEEICKKGADQIVLGCTHYHWIEEEVKDIAKGRAEVIQPEGAVIERLKQVLGQIA